MYRDPVKEALAECVEDFSDALGYVPQYFADKHGYAEALAKARAALAGPSAVGELVVTLGEAWEQIIWMSGSSDFGPEGIAHKGWIKSADLRKRIPEILAKYGAAP